VKVDVRLQEVLQRMKPALNDKHYQTIQAVLESYAYLAELVSDEKMTMDRLREMLWGPEHRADESRDRQRNESANATGGRQRRRRRQTRSRK
jgi:hypothetical protein